MKTLFHFFTADRHHLVPQIVDLLSQDITGFTHKFVLIGSNSKNVDVYQNLANSRTIDYVLLRNIQELKPLNEKIRHQEVYLHGTPYSWMIYLIINRYKKINWICWGSGASINYKNYKSILSFPFKKMIYKSFKKVAVLMPQDKGTLVKYFNLNSIFFVHYSTSHRTFPYDVNKIYENKYNKNTVYIGNNSSSIKSYLGVAKLLSVFNNINVVCMLNYSFKESDVSKSLMKYGKNNFGDRFRFDTELYSLDDYFEYMDRCDIYVCAVKTQTGLGAIYNSLRLGKKLYLTGKNYEWITSLGCKIFHVDDLSSISESNFLTPIPLDDKINNYKILTAYFSKESVRKQWEVFFNAS